MANGMRPAARACGRDQRVEAAITSSLLTRNSFGSRMAWLRPFMKTLPVLMNGLYQMTIPSAGRRDSCHE